jgi:hypothetical protein
MRSRKLSSPATVVTSGVTSVAAGEALVVAGAGDAVLDERASPSLGVGAPRSRRGQWMVRGNGGVQSTTVLPTVAAARNA